MFKSGKKPTALILFLLTVFSYSQLASAEAVIPRPVPRPPAPVPPRPPVPAPPRPAPAKPPVPVPPGAPATVPPGTPAPVPSASPIPVPPRVDPRPATRLGHTGAAAGSRELAPRKLTHEQVLNRIESAALKEQVKNSPEALDGLAVREGLLDSALNGQKELTQKAAGQFERALMEKLVGKDLSKMKEEDLKDLQSLVCAPMCGGHEKMAPSCRRVTRFMEALKSTNGILATSGVLGVLFAGFVDSVTEKVDGSEGVVVATPDGKLLKVKDLDKPVTQEKLVPVPEKSK